MLLPYYQNKVLGSLMKGKIAGLGVFLLVVGALLLAIFLAISLIVVPFTTSEPFEVEWSDYLIDEWSFVLPALSHVNYHRDISSGTELAICFEVTNGSDLGVGFFVADEVNYWKWRAGADANIYLSRSNVLSSLATNWTVPYDDTWYFNWYNKYNLTADNCVTVQITEYWTVTEYRDVTEYRPLIDPSYSVYYAYLGIGILLVGASVLIYGFIAPRGLGTLIITISGILIFFLAFWVYPEYYVGRWTDFIRALVVFMMLIIIAIDLFVAQLIISRLAG